MQIRSQLIIIIQFVRINSAVLAAVARQFSGIVRAWTLVQRRRSELMPIPRCTSPHHAAVDCTTAAGICNSPRPAATGPHSLGCSILSDCVVHLDLVWICLATPFEDLFEPLLLYSDVANVSLVILCARPCTTYGEISLCKAELHALRSPLPQPSFCRYPC